MTLKMGRFSALIFTTLAIFFCGSFCKAQKTNALLFEEMVIEKLRAQPIEVDSILGFSTIAVLAAVDTGTCVGRFLRIEEPEVSYDRLADGRYLRRVATIINYVDTSSQEVGYPLEYSDTIMKKDLRRVRKGSAIELRGEDPRWTMRWLLPIAIIGTGIAGIISLFYLRS